MNPDSRIGVAEIVVFQKLAGISKITIFERAQRKTRHFLPGAGRDLW